MPIIAACLFVTVATGAPAIAKSSNASFRVAADATTVGEVFDACRDVMVAKSYLISAMEKESGFLAASRVARALGDEMTYTWNVNIRPRENEGVIEVMMVMDLSLQHSKPKDLRKLIPEILDTLGLDENQIDVTIDKKTKKASAW